MKNKTIVIKMFDYKEKPMIDGLQKAKETVNKLLKLTERKAEFKTMDSEFKPSDNVIWALTNKETK